MGFSFSDFSNYGNITNVAQTASNTTNGDSAKWQNGNSYSNQKGNSNTIQEGNKNSYQHGISNSVVVGLRFSTNGAASFSTTAGSSMSTVIGANLPNTEGGKVELIIPMSVKWTRGLYDYDFKSCSTQIKQNAGGNVITANSPAVIEMKLTPEGERKVVNKQEDFNKQANVWVKTTTLVAQDKIEKVLEGDMQYVNRKTQVAESDEKTVYGSCKTKATSFLASNLLSTASVTLAPSGECVLKGLCVTINGPLVKLG